LRDDFPLAIIDTLGKRVGMRCSNPGCRLPTSGPQDDPAKAVNVGVAAHVTAASCGGPRYDPTMTSDERRSINNGIWLCQTCSKLIDSDVSRYTVAVLEEWKGKAEGAARKAIESPGAEAIGRGVAAYWWTGCLADGVSQNPDFFMTVINGTEKDLPWLNVHVFPSNTFQLEPTPMRTDRLMPGQYAIYKFRMLEPDGKLTEWASRFSELKRKEVSVRVFRQNFSGDAVLISYELGAELHDRISKFKLITSVPAVPVFSREAENLLKEAVQDARGRLVRILALDGIAIHTNGKRLTEKGNPRSGAMWESALQELNQSGLVVDRGSGEVFHVTRKGYDVATLLNARGNVH
jgi:hypothetical protein